MLLELLEDKHFGRLSPNTIYQLANNDTKFANLWLVHSIRSDCSLTELAIAVAANIKWGTPALKNLENYLNVDSFVDAEFPIDIIEATNSAKSIINNFCENRQNKLLLSLRTFTRKIIKNEIIDEHKYTCKLSFNCEQINTIIKSCEPLLRDVSLFGDTGKNSKNEDIRNNSHFPTPLPNESMALALLENIIAKASGLSISFAEPPVVLRYLPGQYYKWHFDHIYPHTDDIKKHISQFGQRIKTAIFYLNDGFVGGDTEFKTPFKSIVPEKNKVLVFENCDEFEHRDNTSIHRGTPVVSGEKWIVTLWFRNKPFWLRSGLL